MTRITDPDAIRTMRALGPDAFPIGAIVHVKNGERTGLSPTPFYGRVVPTPSAVRIATMTNGGKFPCIWFVHLVGHRQNRSEYYIDLREDCIAEVELPD